MYNIIMIDRLKSMGFYDDPWCVGFEQNMIKSVEGTESKGYWLSTLRNTNYNDPLYHANRIKYLMNHCVDLFYPILILGVFDTIPCLSNKTRYVPSILDGWHRLYAHIELGLSTIFALYKGDKDLLDYLEGKGENYARM